MTTPEITAWQILYILSGVGSLFISRLFYKSKNGWLRKVIITYTLSMSWGLLIVGLTGITKTMLLHLFDDNFIRYVAIIPIFIATTWTMFYLYKTYDKDIFPD